MMERVRTAVEENGGFLKPKYYKKRRIV